MKNLVLISARNLFESISMIQTNFALIFVNGFISKILESAIKHDIMILAQTLIRDIPSKNYTENAAFAGRSLFWSSQMPIPEPQR